jgi:tRNA A-37 threonylcarbamoyl transferase component Bud32
MSRPSANRFHRVREGRTQILVDPGFWKRIRTMGLERVGEVLEKAQIDPERGGRQGLRVFCPGGRRGDRFVIRHYGRGGLLRRILGDRFILGSRPFQEMLITEEIRKRGVPTAQVVAALCHRSWGPFYRGELITKEIPGARDLCAFLSDFGEFRSKKAVALKRETARQAARAVRAMHDQGVSHGDLNLKNLLVQTSTRRGPKVYIIDFDRSKCVPGLSTQSKIKNIFRLNRSVEKWKAQGLRIRYTDKARFFRAYARGDADMILSVRRYLRNYRLVTLGYQIGWLIDRLLNPSPR